MIHEFTWVGSQENYIDKIEIHQVHNISVGLFGGTSKAGQSKNEDGCLVWANEKQDWELALLLDAHHSAESAELILHEFQLKKVEIINFLSLPYTQALKGIEKLILSIFHSGEFKTKCRMIKGESACLIVLRMNNYLWWFSVGDCLCFLFHPEFLALGQYQLNQRQFYEWVGQVNTFELPVPCYSSGIRELRNGQNRILLTTDGLVECPNAPFSSPVNIYEVMKGNRVSLGTKNLLHMIMEQDVRDSTTIISWDVNILTNPMMPSDL